MKQVLLLGKWGMEADDAGMKQDEVEDWRAERSEGERDRGRLGNCLVP